MTENGQSTAAADRARLSEFIALAVVEDDLERRIELLSRADALGARLRGAPHAHGCAGSA